MGKDFKITYSKAFPENGEQIKSLLMRVKGDVSNFSTDQFIVAKDEEKIIGCIRIKELTENRLELASLAVLEKYHNKGIGSSLVKEILKKEERRPIYLFTSSDMRDFYRGFEFEVIKPEILPTKLREEYSRITKLPFTKSIRVITMKIGKRE